MHSRTTRNLRGINYQLRDSANWRTPQVEVSITLKNMGDSLDFIFLPPRAENIAPVIGLYLLIKTDMKFGLLQI